MRPRSREQHLAANTIHVTALLDHALRSNLRDMERAGEVDLHCRVPAFLTDVEELITEHNPGIGDRDVDLLFGRKSRFDLRTVGDVALAVGYAFT